MNLDNSTDSAQTMKRLVAKLRSMYFASHTTDEITTYLDVLNTNRDVDAKVDSEDLEQKLIETIKDFDLQHLHLLEICIDVLGTKLSLTRMISVIINLDQLVRQFQLFRSESQDFNFYNYIIHRQILRDIARSIATNYTIDHIPEINDQNFTGSFIHQLSSYRNSRNKKYGDVRTFHPRSIHRSIKTLIQELNSECIMLEIG